MTACPANRSRLRWRVSEIQDLDLPRTASVMPFPHGPYVEATADPYKVKISTPINSAKKAATNLTLATPLSVLCSRPGMLACSTRSVSPRFPASLCGVFLQALLYVLRPQGCRLLDTIRSVLTEELSPRSCQHWAGSGYIKNANMYVLTVLSLVLQSTKVEPLILQHLKTYVCRHVPAQTLRTEPRPTCVVCLCCRTFPACVCAVLCAACFTGGRLGLSSVTPDDRKA